ASDWLHNDWVERSKSGGSEPLIYYRMKEKIIKRIWQPFKEKYVDCAEINLFKSETLMEWFERVNNSDRQAGDSLLNAMAMTVFKELCLRSNLNPHIGYLYGGSVL
ncbi:MAG: asparagine synthetase B, partial [Hormoscilla sp.]